MRQGSALTLFAFQRRAGLFVTPDLSLVTHAQGTDVFFPLFTVLVHLASCRTGLC